MDAVSALAIIAGFTGSITGFGALAVNRRDAKTRADTGYVDRNLKAMQAIVDAQIAENKRIHDQLGAENERLRADLEDCEGRCGECLARIRALEQQQQS